MKITRVMFANPVEDPRSKRGIYERKTEFTSSEDLSIDLQDRHYVLVSSNGCRLVHESRALFAEPDLEAPAKRGKR